MLAELLNGWKTTMPFVSGKCKEPRSIIPIETQYVFDGMEIGGGGPLAHLKHAIQVYYLGCGEGS